MIFIARKDATIGWFARTLMAVSLVAAVWLVAIGSWEIAAFPLLVAVAGPVAGYVAGKDREVAESGSEFRAPPAGLDGRGFGGGGG